MIPNANRYFGNSKQAPRWAGDFLRRTALCPWPAIIDPSQFNDAGGIQIVATAIAAANATSITVAALTLPASQSLALVSTGNVIIPKGTTLYFNVSKEFALTTADAKIGDTTITVQALPTALAVGDTAVYNFIGNQKLIPSGTLVGRTFAQRDAGTGFGPANTATHDEIFLLAFDVQNALVDNSIALVKKDIAFTVKENYLPNYGTNVGQLNAGGTGSVTLTWIRAHYNSITGVD